jgi:hypothetical protein
MRARQAPGGGRAPERPLPPELADALGPFQRRAHLDGALRWGLLAVTAWAAAAALVMAWSKLSPMPGAGAIAAGLGALAVAGGAAAWAIGRPPPAQVARVTDARLDLKERLASALDFAGLPGDLHGRLVDDAIQRAHEHRPADAFPLQRHSRRALAAGLSVAVAAALAFTPNPQAGALARRSADQAVLSQAKRTVRVARKALKKEGGKEAAQAEQELEQALAQLQRARTPLQALTALSALQSELASLPDLESQGEAAAAAAGAALAGAPGAGKLSLDLSRGDLKAAAYDLRQLAKALAGLSPAEQRALAKALENASQQAAARQGPGQPGSQQGQGQQGTAPTSGPQSLASQLAQAAQALASGKTGPAEKDLGSAASGANASASAASLQQELAAIQAAVHNAQSAVAAQAQADSSGHGAKSNGAAGKKGLGKGHGGAIARYATGSGAGKGANPGAVAGHGEGSGSGQGSGNGSGSSRGGAGAGSGNGSGTGQGGSKRPSDQVFVGGQPGSSEQVVGRHLGNGYRVKTTDYQNVLPSFEKTALQGLGSQVVSPADQNLVRDYFSSLGGGKR